MNRDSSEFIEMNEPVPAISVITIVKNNEELLPRAVDSVLRQTLTDFEYIIVNDGSIDGTGGIIEEYAAQDKRVLPLHISKNVGRAKARNTGMDAAKGQYIFFLDSDDYLPSTALLDLYEVAEEDNADIVYGRIKSFDQATGAWRPHYYTDKIISSERHGLRLDDHLDLVDNHQIVGRIFRHRFLKEREIRFSTQRQNAEDVLFSFYSAFHAESLSMVPWKTIYFYSFGKQLEAVNEIKLFDARDNLLETIDFALKHGSISLKKRMLQKGVIFAGNLYRAQKVYEGQEEKFLTYLTTLVPFVKDIGDDILADLPLDYLNFSVEEIAHLSSYYRRFAKTLQSGDVKQAHTLWEQKQKKSAMIQKKEVNKQEVLKLRHANKKLVEELEHLYNSRSWRITAPLRQMKKLVARKR
ncbi:MAG TPA: glycosyltransferase family 2 protein [Mariniphaga anaerophila]|uniref:Glycosyltransferase family 2 protein n=1 Tax=Mariniphaga anaerophila TaxID=1484053 RepID=A0A831LN59_9BACT|nr:glycosyltransferase family 2 protein [Mariniphaga anaerophila]